MMPAGKACVPLSPTIRREGEGRRMVVEESDHNHKVPVEVQAYSFMQ